MKSSVLLLRVFQVCLLLASPVSCLRILPLPLPASGIEAYVTFERVGGHGQVTQDIIKEIFAPSDDFTMVVTTPTTESYEALEPEDVTKFDKTSLSTQFNHFATVLKDTINRMFPFTTNPVDFSTANPVSTVSSQPPQIKPGGVEGILTTSVGTLDSSIPTILGSTISSTMDSTPPSTSDSTVPPSDGALQCDILPPDFPGCSEFLKSSGLEEVLPESLEEVLPESLEEVLPESLEEVLPESLEEVLPESLDGVEADTPGYRNKAFKSPVIWEDVSKFLPPGYVEGLLSSSLKENLPPSLLPPGFKIQQEEFPSFVLSPGFKVKWEEAPASLLPPGYTTKKEAHPTSLLPPGPSLLSPNFKKSGVDGQLLPGSRGEEHFDTYIDFFDYYQGGLPRRTTTTSTTPKPPQRMACLLNTVYCSLFTVY